MSIAYVHMELIGGQWVKVTRYLAPEKRTRQGQTPSRRLKDLPDSVREYIDPPGARLVYTTDRALLKKLSGGGDL